MIIPEIWIYWILSMTIVTYASAYVVKNYREIGYTALVGFYILYLTMSQIIATRFVEFDLLVITFYAPAAVLIYPFLAQAVDMINEVYGEYKTHIAIGIAFVANVLMIIILAMSNMMEAAPFFEYESAWESLFSLSIRIIIASWLSYLVCQNLDAYIFSRLKEKFPENIVVRSVFSDVISLSLDSIIFVTVAFYGIVPIMPLIIGQIVMKNLIGTLDTPWFVWYKKYLSKPEIK
ncbi:queuosine precursor transporter [Methanoplanus sp. FWC-SCC4]|uniref:Probable queuosine precursor transporter n=1 Tax=Methanochimaera problematica TaxID=2609417 RepID=A0AA97FAJ3_9EURY|nr:queuosine precursor transporter [Methanoplanus sp. FWC-SCC4]WOF15835.1 queuosine precursor transporter [Methanoplanus sp. FWC-SCC4]